jgi:hypothetical protein
MLGRWVAARGLLRYGPVLPVLAGAAVRRGLPRRWLPWRGLPRGGLPGGGLPGGGLPRRRLAILPGRRLPR